MEERKFVVVVAWREQGQAFDRVLGIGATRGEAWTDAEAWYGDGDGLFEDAAVREVAANEKITGHVAEVGPGAARLVRS